MYLAFDNRRTTQHDAVRLDGALKAAADRQFLCGDGAFHFGAVRDAHNGSVKLAFDSTKEIQGSLTGNLSDNCHAGTDAGDIRRI